MTTFNVGDHAIATDASGTDHRVTVSKAPWRGFSMAVIGLTFDDLPATHHSHTIWPLDAVRPAEGQP